MDYYVYMYLGRQILILKIREYFMHVCTYNFYKSKYNTLFVFLRLLRFDDISFIYILMVFNVHRDKYTWDVEVVYNNVIVHFPISLQEHYIYALNAVLYLHYSNLSWAPSLLILVRKLMSEYRLIVKRSCKYEVCNV